MSLSSAVWGITESMTSSFLLSTLQILFTCAHSSVFLVPVHETFLTWHLSSHFPILLAPFGVLSSSFMSSVNTSCSCPGVVLGLRPLCFHSHATLLAHPCSRRPFVWTIVELKWEEHSAQMEPRISEDYEKLQWCLWTFCPSFLCVRLLPHPR